MCCFCMFFQITLKPFQEQFQFNINGHLIFPYTQRSWCLAICSIENNSKHPLCLLAQVYFCLLAMFSRTTFLVSKISARHVGQHWTLSVQLLQMLWPFLHSFMGGTMYCVHTGHSRSFSITSPTPRAK